MADSAGTSDDTHPYFELIQQFKVCFFDHQITSCLLSLIYGFQEICAVDDQVAQICIEQADGDLQSAINRFLSVSFRVAFHI